MIEIGTILVWLSDGGELPTEYTVAKGNKLYVEKSKETFHNYPIHILEKLLQEGTIRIKQEEYQIY